MSEACSSLASAADGSPWKPDEIFSLLAEPPRRRVLQALADGGAAAATGLTAVARLRPDATLKHLTTLRDAGLLLTAPDPQDKRRTLYRLAPSVPVVKTETGMAIDFGFCVLLCRGKIQLAGILRAPEPLGKD